MRGTEQGSRGDGALLGPGGPVGQEDENSNGVDHIRERREFYPVGGVPQRGGEQRAGAVLIPVRQHDQGQPGLDERTEPLPPGRLLTLEPGEHLLALPGGGGGIALTDEQFRPHQAEPHRRVGLETALGLFQLCLFQVGAGGRQVACPQPDRGEVPADMGQVAPGAKLLAQRCRLLQGLDGGRVVRPQPGELRELDQRGRGSPRIAERAEGRQGAPALGFGLVLTADHAPERAAHQRHCRPQPRVRRCRVPVEHGQGPVGIAVVQGQHWLAHRGKRMSRDSAGRPLRQVGQGRRQRWPDGVNVEERAGRDQRADDPGLCHERGTFSGLQREHLAGQRLRLARLSPQYPVPAERPHEPQRGIGLLPGDHPAQSRVQVVLLGGQLTQPPALPGGAQLRFGGFGQVQVVRGGSIPHPVLLARLG